MTTRHYPFYLRSTVILFGLVLFVIVLFFTRGVLVPLSFALLLAILLNPLTNLLMKAGLGHVSAITISILLAIAVTIGISYFLSSEIAGLTESWPLLKKKSADMLGQLQQWARSELGISFRDQNKYLEDLQSGLKSFAASTVGTVMGTLELAILLPVYTFLFLYYKTLLLNFLYELFAEENASEVAEVLKQTKLAIQSYMFGLLLEALIVATLNSIALLALGVNYAILLGIIGAILNVLPFIGGIIAIALPVVVATVTKDGYGTQLGILAAYIVIQFIDNHFIVPYIVSSRVRINALISLVAVLLGGALWGIAGMFLSIPFVGVLKIVFDRVPELRSWGKLLGDQVPTQHKGQLWMSRRRKKAVLPPG